MAMAGHDLTAGTAKNYRDFAAETRGRSAQYERLSLAVAEDPLVLGFLDRLPARKRQPNLLFAAARYLMGEPAEIDSLRTLIRVSGDKLAGVMRARRTQTNEPARCATLLPALALLPQPLALIEVGASAGLTLLVDRYSYDYRDADGRGHRIAGTDPRAPVLTCQLHGPVPLPASVPGIAWRAGLDLNPLDVTSAGDMRWLESMLWPGESGRAERLKAAIATARRDPVPVHRGDLLTDVPALAAQAPTDATLVIFHSAVLAYVSEQERARFAETIRGLKAVWLSNEGPGVISGVAVPARGGQRFVLVRDGREAIAFTDGHGTWIEWLA